jgi:hypothetical protein
MDCTQAGDPDTDVSLRLAERSRPGRVRTDLLRARGRRCLCSISEPAPFGRQDAATRAGTLGRKRSGGWIVDYVSSLFLMLIIKNLSLVLIVGPVTLHSGIRHDMARAATSRRL